MYNELKPDWLKYWSLVCLKLSSHFYVQPKQPSQQCAYWLATPKVRTDKDKMKPHQWYFFGGVQLLWHSWQRGRFRCQRTHDRIQPLAPFIEQFSVVNLTVEKTKIKKKAGNGPLIRVLEWIIPCLFFVFSTVIRHWLLFEQLLYKIGLIFIHIWSHWMGDGRQS